MGFCSIGSSIKASLDKTYQQKSQYSALAKMERNFTEAYSVVLKTVQISKKIHSMSLALKQPCQTAPVIHGCMTTLAPNSRTTGDGYIYS